MRILIVGCGPGGERWREIAGQIQADKIIAVNSAIADCAHDADVFLCVENLSGQPARDHPWIMTKTRAYQIINEQTLRRLGSRAPAAEPFYRPETPLIYRDTQVGTALYHAALVAESTTVSDNGGFEVHLIGFPLYFADGVQHWTDTGDLYRPGASYWLPPIVFQSVNGMASTWAFIMAAAYFKAIQWRFPIVNHSGGLLDIPGIERLWKRREFLPFSCEIKDGIITPHKMQDWELAEIVDRAPLEQTHAPRDHILATREELGL